MADAQQKVKDIPLTGKLVTSVPSIAIGENNYQELVNLKSRLGRLEGIQGMSKINTTALTTNLKIRSGFHFRKEQPAESHVLVQSFNSALNASSIKENLTAIPNQGDFSATELLADAGTVVGNWSTAPNGNCVFCNQAGAYIYGGDEARVGSLINYAPDDSFRYDYSEAVQNTLDTGAGNIATLYRVTESVDANTMLLLHLDNNVTDYSPATIHTVTNTNGTFSSADPKFGTHELELNGTDAKLTIPDDADFDFSGGDFTVDGWFVVDDLDNDHPIYYHYTVNDDDSFKIYVDTGGQIGISLKVGGVEQLNGGSGLLTSTVIVAGTRYHIEVAESGDKWYIFVNGSTVLDVTDVARCADYTAVVSIGYDLTNWYDGRIDEYRVSNIARHTGNFEVPGVAYGSSTYRTYMYLGAVRPLHGFKFYVKTANTGTGAMTVEYWSGSTWAGVGSLTDNTSSGGVSLAQTGTVTFTSTDGSNSVSLIDGIALYWYRVTVTEVDETTTLSYVTVDMPFQKVKDMWNGLPIECLSFQKFDGTKFIDYTTNVYDDYYEASFDNTWAVLDSLTSVTDYLACGFYKPQMGITFNFIPEKGNATANTVATVYYWNGTAWTSVGAIKDGTASGGVSFAKSGIISWNPVAEGTEFTREISQEVPLYYYKVEFSQNLDGEVECYHVSGIPAPIIMKSYSYPVHAGDSLWLLSERENFKNKMIRTETGTENVYSSEEALTIMVGDETELIAGAAIYMQLGSSLYEVLIVCKKNETWMITPGLDGLQKFRISNEIGCVAPGTMKTKSIGDINDKETFRNITIWQGADGIYMFDGKSPIPIHRDIEDLFDKKNSYSINTNKIGDSQGFWDEAGGYHWCFAGGTSTTLDKEFVVIPEEDWRWFEVKRNTNKALQCGIQVSDTNGNNYAYGTIDTGYMERLDNGTSFDGSDIVHTVHIGSFAGGGNLLNETILKRVSLQTGATNTTTNKVQGSYYKDTNTVADATFELEPQKASREVVNDLKNISSEGRAIFHSIKLEMTTDDEPTGFQPLAISVTTKDKGIREKKR